MWLEYTLQGAIVVAMLFALALIRRPSRLGTPAGRILALVGLLVLPLLVSVGSTKQHLEKSKSTEFCLSCHTMEPYGKSLFLDDKEHLPAVHYQNRLVPRESACFACHTSYTMYGDFAAKMKGMRHLWVQYFGDIPEKIQLYEPYNKRECLHCHEGTRSFLEQDARDEDVFAELASGEITCFECHEKHHQIHEPGEKKYWKGGALK